VLLSSPEPFKGRGVGHYLTVNIFRMQEVVFLLLSTVFLSPPEPAQGRGGGHYLTVNIFRMQEVVFLLLSTAVASLTGQGEGRRSLLTVNIFRMQEVVFLLLSTVLLSPPEPAQGKGGFLCSAGRHLNIPPQIKQLKITRITLLPMVKRRAMDHFTMFEKFKFILILSMNGKKVGKRKIFCLRKKNSP
jgi:hypothetical protein